MKDHRKQQLSYFNLKLQFTLSKILLDNVKDLDFYKYNGQIVFDLSSSVQKKIIDAIYKLAIEYGVSVELNSEFINTNYNRFIVCRSTLKFTKDDQVIIYSGIGEADISQNKDRPHEYAVMRSIQKLINNVGGDFYMKTIKFIRNFLNKYYVPKASYTTAKNVEEAIHIFSEYVYPKVKEKMKKVEDKYF